jgi:hypothetical protein
MIRRSPLYMSLLGLLAAFAATGCGGGAGPLVMSKKRTNLEPWCGPNERVRVGMRVVGHAGWNGDKWANFLVDGAGKEHDPEKIAERVWSYLERTGDARRIQETFSKEGYDSSMNVVSVNPVVVVLERHRDADWQKHPRGPGERYYWLAQVYMKSDPPYAEGLQWFSPELKRKPTPLAFSADGVAEIPFAGGKIKLVREGDKCKTTRE